MGDKTEKSKIKHLTVISAKHYPDRDEVVLEIDGAEITIKSGPGTINLPMDLAGWVEFYANLQATDIGLPKNLTATLENVGQNGAVEWRVISIS